MKQLDSLTSGDLFVLGMFGAAASAVLLLWLIVRAARFSADRYGYAIFLNWNVALWLAGLVGAALVIKAATEGIMSRTGIALGFGASGIPWLIAIWRNIANTNFVFGLLITIPQMLFSVLGPFAALWMKGMVFDRPHHQR